MTQLSITLVHSCSSPHHFLNNTYYHHHLPRIIGLLFLPCTWSSLRVMISMSVESQINHCPPTLKVHINYNATCDHDIVTIMAILEK